ncbi:MAG: AAA family ATPase [Longimicrobiaceae bacterium]
MARYIRSVKAVGIHGRFDLECEFVDGVNIIYGENGTGKTTLLHILANVLNGDYERFFYLDFSTVEVRLDDGQVVSLRLNKRKVGGHEHTYVEVNGIQATGEFCNTRDRVIGSAEEARTIRERDRRASRGDRPDAPRLPLTAAYFPAFRTAIDAWAAHNEETSPRPSTAAVRHRRDKTDFARVLFGNFVPRLEYPATNEIEWTLNEQVRIAIASVSRADRQYFGEVPSRILETLSDRDQLVQDPDEVLEEIKLLSKRFQDYPIHVESTWTELDKSVRAVPKNEQNKRVAAAVLSVYRTALERIIRVQERAFSKIERYLFTVNSFLHDKSINIGPAEGRLRSVPSVRMEFEGEKVRSIPLHRALSSGERQIVTLIYASTQMSQQEVILVDEPEISLHVDWQRKLLPAMVKQMPSKQLIVCTHSPVISTRYRERMQELNPSISRYVSTGTPTMDLFEDTDEVDQ